MVTGQLARPEEEFTSSIHMTTDDYVAIASSKAESQIHARIRTLNDQLNKQKDRLRKTNREIDALVSATEKAVEEEFKEGCDVHKALVAAVAPFGFVEDRYQGDVTFRYHDDNTATAVVTDSLTIFCKTTRASHTYSRTERRDPPENFNNLLAQRQNIEDEIEQTNRNIIIENKNLGNLAAVERSARSGIAKAKLSQMGERGAQILNQIEGTDISGFIQPALPPSNNS